MVGEEESGREGRREQRETKNRTHGQPFSSGLWLKESYPEKK